MSILFLIDRGQDIWNPSNETGRLFHSQVELVASLLCVESGFGAIRSDEVRIDVGKFGAFGVAFARRMFEVQNPAFTALLSGTFAIVLAFLDSMRIPMPLQNERLSQVQATGWGLIR